MESLWSMSTTVRESDRNLWVFKGGKKIRG